LLQGSLSDVRLPEGERGDRDVNEFAVISVFQAALPHGFRHRKSFRRALDVINEVVKYVVTPSPLARGEQACGPVMKGAGPGQRVCDGRLLSGGRVDPAAGQLLRIEPDE